MSNSQGEDAASAVGLVVGIIAGFWIVVKAAKWLRSSTPKRYS